jgi:outer membrane protein assembly factor BamB
MMTAKPLRLRLRRAVAVAALALALPGCGMVPWLSSEKDPTPPTKLAKNAPQLAQVRTLWKTRIGKGTDDRALNLVPAVSGGRVYAADARGRVSALSAGDGRTLWERDTRLPLSGGPDLSGDRLALGSSDGDVLLLSSSDGSQRWRTRVGSEILSVPRIVGDLVVVHTVDDTVYGLELSDGSQRWTYSYPAPILTLRGSSSPVPAGEGVLVGISGGRLMYLEPEQGAPLWDLVISPPSGRSELDRLADIDADPVVVDGIAYVASYNGDLAAVDIASGTVLWRRELSAHAGLAAGEEALYITDSDDNLWAAAPSDGAGLWKQEGLLYRRLTAPALAGSALVVGDIEGYVHWVSRRDGRLLGRERVSKSRIGATPLVAGGVVYVQADDGTVAALRAGPAAGGTPPAPATAVPPAAPSAADA